MIQRVEFEGSESHIQTLKIRKIVAKDIWFLRLLKYEAICEFTEMYFINFRFRPKIAKAAKAFLALSCCLASKEILNQSP